MKMTCWRGVRVMLYGVIVVVVVVLDQATKAAVRHLLEVGESVGFVPGVLDLKLVHNTGAAFSLGEGAGPIFVLVAIAILIAGWIFVWKQPNVPLALAVSVACVAGGGVGNMIDRLFMGYVTDFFATTFMNFPVFNVADIFVTCGVIVSFVIYTVWESRREPAVGEADPSHRES